VILPERFPATPKNIMRQEKTVLIEKRTKAILTLRFREKLWAVLDHVTQYGW
jgi:hypothetical protein